MAMWFPNLVAFEDAVDRLWVIPSDAAYDAAVVELGVLLGSPDIVAVWLKRPDLYNDLQLTVEQLHLCRLLAGEHGPTIKRMLEAQRG